MHDAETRVIPGRYAGGSDPARLNADAVRAAYARWSGVYDTVFGGVFAAGRRRAVGAANALPGREVLEVGVGTGLSLPFYAPDKRVTGIDLSPPMLDRAGARARRLGRTRIAALLEMDAEAMTFPDASFDIAVAMFVASVVPDARRLLAEMRRVVRPGGTLLFVNHFAAEGGPRLAVERALASLSHRLGWHPDFSLGELLSATDRAGARIATVPPLGLFRLVSLQRVS
jgi:phosphatidylethanolamine/phosphatidyl-N-methylethanolamine N-methyltransferase